MLAPALPMTRAAGTTGRKMWHGTFERRANISTHHHTYQHHIQSCQIFRGHFIQGWPLMGNQDTSTDLVASNFPTQSSTKVSGVSRDLSADLRIFHEGPTTSTNQTNHYEGAMTSTNFVDLILFRILILTIWPTAAGTLMKTPNKCLIMAQYALLVPPGLRTRGNSSGVCSTAFVPSSSWP